MDVALFDTREQAEGFVALLRDVDGVIARVKPEDGLFGVAVPDEQGFRASVIYRLYYIKGLSLEELPRRPRAERLGVLAEHRAYAQARGRSFPDPGSESLEWFKRRAHLSDEELATALPRRRRRFPFGRG